MISVVIKFFYVYSEVKYMNTYLSRCEVDIA